VILAKFILKKQFAFPNSITIIQFEMSDTDKIN